MQSPWEIRPLIREDREAAIEIFYHGLYDQGASLPDRAILDRPILQPYLADFPNDTDIGLLALDCVNGAPAGVVYCRFFEPDFCGVGFYRRGIPELSIGVMPAYRGRGCGTVLMSATLRETDARRLDVSLNCNPKNPAHRLYERFGFAVIASRPIGDLMLREARIGS